MLLFAVTAFAASSQLRAQTGVRARARAAAAYNARIVKLYTDSLMSIVAADSARRAAQASDSSDAGETLGDPYFYPLLLTPTLYDRPISKMMSLTWQPLRLHSTQYSLSPADGGLGDSLDLARTQAMVWAYTNVPWLVTGTQRDIDAASSIRKEMVEQPVKEITHITPADEVPVDIGIEDASFKVVTRRPNFWSKSMSLSFNMAQNFVTSNWYQGDQRNNSFRIVTENRLNYDNQRGFKFNNYLLFRLGFVSQHKDTKHKYGTNDDRLQYTGDIGLTAIKHLDYSLQLNVWTQSYPKYASNSDRVTSDFLSPVEGNLSIGMKYSIDFKNKKKKTVFHIDTQLSPLSYHAKYCDRKALRNGFGIPGKHHAYNDFGPNFTLNYSWPIMKNVSTSGRIYYYSNLHYASANYTSTTNFTINKYMSAQLYMYTIYQDNRHIKGKREFWQFQENLSLGLSLRF